MARMAKLSARDWRSANFVALRELTFFGDRVRRLDLKALCTDIKRNLFKKIIDKHV